MSAMRVLVPVADGSEDIETVMIVDVLRRAGAEVQLASVAPDGRRDITASRRTRIVADCHIDDVAAENFDLIAVPGGMPGAENLRDNPTLTALLRAQRDGGRYYGAICAAPAVVLHAHGLIDGPATAHPDFVDRLPMAHADQRVVIDGHCITGQAAGTSLEFALTLVELLYGKVTRDDVAAQMVAV